MINVASLKPNQLQLVNSIIAFHVEKAKTPEEKARFEAGLFRRKEIHEASVALTGHACNPYFITKNTFSKFTGNAEKVPGGVSVSFDLTKFITYAEKHPYKAPEPKAVKPAKAEKAEKTVKTETETEKPAGKKEAQGKKENKGKKTDKPVVVDASVAAIATVE